MKTSTPSFVTSAKAGLLGGFLSGIVKFGWEVPLPPRSPQRNETNPPQAMLELLGVPAEVTHANYTYNENEKLPWVSFIMHFGFSITFALLYCVAARRFPKITALQGVLYGLLVWIVFHLIVLPALKVVPRAGEQPWEEHLSEALGHAVWMWTVDIVRRRYTSK